MKQAFKYLDNLFNLYNNNLYNKSNGKIVVGGLLKNEINKIFSVGENESEHLIKEWLSDKGAGEEMIVNFLKNIILNLKVEEDEISLVLENVEIVQNLETPMIETCRGMIPYSETTRVIDSELRVMINEEINDESDMHNLSNIILAEPKFNITITDSIIGSILYGYGCFFKKGYIDNNLITLDIHTDYVNKLIMA